MMPAPLAEVVSDFQEVEGQDKLRLLLEFADELPPLPADMEQAAMEPVPLSGAQTANETPFTPSCVTTCAPSFS